MENEDYQIEFQEDINTEVLYAGPVKRALNFGSRTADGIVLLLSKEQRSEQQIDDIGMVLMAFVEDFGFTDEPSDEMSRLREAVSSDNKDDIRQAVDNLFAQVEILFKKSEDEDLALYVSLGGWIKALSIISGSLASNYDQAVAETVMAQKVVLDTYVRMLGGLGDYLEAEPLLARLYDQLRDLQALFPEEGKEVDQAKIARINDIAEVMKTAIEA